MAAEFSRRRRSPVLSFSRVGVFDLSVAIVHAHHHDHVGGGGGARQHTAAVDDALEERIVLLDFGAIVLVDERVAAVRTAVAISFAFCDLAAARARHTASAGCAAAAAAAARAVGRVVAAAGVCGRVVADSFARLVHRRWRVHATNWIVRHSCCCC